MLEVLYETTIKVEKDLDTGKIRLLLKKEQSGKTGRWIKLWEE